MEMQYHIPTKPPIWQVILTLGIPLLMGVYLHLVSVDYSNTSFFKAKMRQISRVLGKTKVPKAPKLSNNQLWALATSSIYMEVNGYQHDQLQGIEWDNKEAIDRKRRALAESWGIDDRESLLMHLGLLAEHGHRSTFSAQGLLLAGMSSSEYLSYKHLASNPARITDDQFMMDECKRSYPELKEESLLGWDLSRYVMLCRWGYLLGYISEEEAWSFIMPAAKALHNTFRSWYALGNNYILGRKYWSHRQTALYGKQYIEAFDKLRNDRDSPWQKHQWNSFAWDKTNELPWHIIMLPELKQNMQELVKRKKTLWDEYYHIGIRKNLSEAINTINKLIKQQKAGQDVEIELKEASENLQSAYKEQNAILTAIDMKPLNSNQVWALASNAMITEHSRQSHLRIRSLARNDLKEKAQLEKNFTDKWKIHSRKDLFNRLTHFAEKGLRNTFSRMGQTTTKMTSKEYDAYITKLNETASKQDIAKIERIFDFTRTHYPQPKDSSLLAFDLNNYISLCRWGVVLGYLSEEEAWSFIMPAAKALHISFNSWGELGRNQLLGHDFKNIYKPASTNNKWKATYQELTTNSNSPWKTVLWSSFVWNKTNELQWQILMPAEQKNETNEALAK